MASNYQKFFENDYADLVSRFEKMDKTTQTLNDTISMLNKTINTLNNTINSKDDLINKLLLENERLKNNNNKDSSNSGKPSSTDGFKKPKQIINSRPKTDKKKGGQSGHKGKTTDVSKIANLIKIGKIKHTVIDINKTDKNKNNPYITRYVQDIEIINVVREIRYYPNESGKYNIPREQNNVLTYGEGVKGISMLLVHRLPASMDKVRDFLGDITDNALDITKATLVNWSSKLSIKLTPFTDEILRGLMDSVYVHTDESPINVDGSVYQLHNYSNNKYTLQYIHKNRTKAAMYELGFLNNYLGTLIHDHNLVQYNFGTRNAECNSHILRYLKANDEFTKHFWSKDMGELLREILHQKHLLQDKDVNSFSQEKSDKYSKEYDEILKKASKEYQSNIKTNPYRDDERRLITRLGDYKENHLIFMYDFNIPFSNNRAEADIRPAKRKLNVGIFRSEVGAKYYIQIRSFISTFLKNELNIFNGIKDVFANKKITLQEV